MSLVAANKPAISQAKDCLAFLLFPDEIPDVYIVERLFSSSLVVVVSHAKPQQMNVYHFKKGTEICNYSYSSNILSIRLNRQVRSRGGGLGRLVPLRLFAGVDFAAGNPLPGWVCTGTEMWGWRGQFLSSLTSSTSGSVTSDRGAGGLWIYRNSLLRSNEAKSLFS